VVAFDDRRIAPIRAGKPHVATAGRLNKRGCDREAFFRGAPKRAAASGVAIGSCSSTRLISVE
jgi:hypothetical protein